MTDVELATRRTLEADPAITSVELTGSRGRGDAAPFSDWDFVVRTDDFLAVADRLPALVAPLGALGELWDPLSEQWCYMFMLPGPTKIDLMFERPHRASPPWTADAPATDVDCHFWDWIWWLATKDRRGMTNLVGGELSKMQAFLLGPIGGGTSPDGIAAAVAAYRRVRPSLSALGAEVCAGLRHLGYEI